MVGRGQHVARALRARRIPYRVVRGRSFYDRAEVKDVAAYLRLCVNPRSDGDLLRVINVPPRGIGDTTVDHLRASVDPDLPLLYVPYLFTRSHGLRAMNTARGLRPPASVSLNVRSQILKSMPHAEG